MRIPKQSLVGEENRGWYQLMHSLSYERVSLSLSCCGFNRRLFDELLQYAKDSTLFKNPLIRHKFADMAVLVEMNKMFAYQTVWKMSRGETLVYEPSRDKVFNDEVQERLASTGMEILGSYSQIDPLHGNSKWAKLRGFVERVYWLFPGISIAAGTDDIERNIISHLGLKLPKSY